MQEPFDQLTIAELTADIDAQSLTFTKALQLYKTIYLPSRNLAESTRHEYLSDLRNLITIGAS